MKHLTWEGMKGNFRFLIIVGAVLSLMTVSCVPDSDKLGVDIFPPNDTILIHTDTISNFETRLVRSRPWITSLNRLTAGVSRTFFLGNRVDSMTGSAKAEIVAQFGLSQVGNFLSSPPKLNVSYKYVRLRIQNILIENGIFFDIFFRKLIIE